MTSRMKTLSTSSIAWMAACSTSGGCKPTQRLMSDKSWISSSQTMLPLFAHTQKALQCITSCFAESAQLFELEVSLKKTEVLHQPAPQEEYHAPHISIGETNLKSLQQFMYLCCTISSNVRIDGEINNILAKANCALGRLYKCVWNNIEHLKSKMKISVYRAVVLTTLQYGSESWVTYWNHFKLLKRFHQRCIRTVLNTHWSDYINNLIVLERADITSIESMLLKIQLRWAWHVSRMEDHTCPSSFYLVNSLLASKTEGHQRSITKIH